MSRGTRGLVTTEEERTGSVGDSSAPSRKASVQPRSVSALIASATSTAVSGIASTSLRSGRCHAFCNISASTSSPSRKRISTSAITASACTKSERGSRSSTSNPPCPSTNPATTNTGASDRKLRRASPDSSAPIINIPPNTAAGSCRKSTPAATGGTPGSYLEGCVRRALAPLAVLLVALFPAAAAAAPPRPQTLSAGWEVRNQAAAPAPDQQAPPLEGQPEDVPAGSQTTPGGTAAQQTTRWTPVTIPSVFDTKAMASKYGGEVRRYRLHFKGPPTPSGFRWLIEFESVRRSATVFLNGRRLGKSVDPYTPFTLEARGLRPGRDNL